MKLETNNISNWLKSLSDSELTTLQAHCEDGKLSYMSCSCLIGSRTANHALGTAGDYCIEVSHMDEARLMPYAADAEREFKDLGNPGDGVTSWSDELRRERLMPLIVSEHESRNKSLTVRLELTKQPSYH